MVRLVYSNRTEELLAELAVRVRAQQGRDGALAPVRVVVPSASVEGYLRLGIARHEGVAANLEFSRLTGFAAETIRAASGVQLADASAIEAMALRLLLDDGSLAHDDLAPVRAYLRGGGDAPEPMDVRRVQLATRIGRLFEEYTYSRGEMLAAWRQGPTLQERRSKRREKSGEAGERHAETERWQRRLWLAMFGAEPPGSTAAPSSSGAPSPGSSGGPAPRAARVVPLHEAVAALDPKAAGLPRAVHIFGFAHVARGFLELIERIASATEVFLYALSPCEGFWEDPDAADPVPLHLWGRPGREQVRVLNAIARFDHDDRFVDPLEGDRPGGRTLLRRIQSDILRREPAVPSPPAPLPASSALADGSLLVLEHSSVRREIEAVASEIWRLLEVDPTLHLDEIAVLLPEADARTYGAQVSAVFRESHDLPHRVSSAAALARGGGVVEAVELLLALPLGKFSRQDLLRVILHPAVLRAVVSTTREVDPVRWASWCDALGVVHGADRGDHADTYIERDLFNWDQGLRRLALGAFMAGDASGDPRPFEAGGHAYVPCEVSAGELHDAAAFGLLVRSLVADLRFARESELTMREWAGFLCKLVEVYIGPSGAPEEEQLARCLRRLHGLGDVDLGDARVRYRVACELARQRIGALPGGNAGEGVVVTTLASLRSLPFRVVFACGMGEGQFPSADAEDPLDLRWARRREGDVTARERDKYSFLELLLGVRDRLYLSYVAREPLTGEALSPSSVVEELLHAVQRSYVRDVSTLRRRHPLRRWEPPYFPELFDRAAASPSPLGTMRLAEAHAEARTLALRRSNDRGGRRLDPEEVLLARARDPAWAGLADHLGLMRLLDAAPVPDGRMVVPMHAILKFLEFPLQGWARYRVGLDEVDDDDPMAREDEPFETDVRREVVFLREVLLEAVARNLPVEQAYDEAVKGRELRGAGPSGLFARGERGPHLATLNGWCEELAARGESARDLEVMRFGRAGEHARSGQVHDALVLDLEVVDPAGVARMKRVEIGGRTLPMGAGAASSITLVKRPKLPWDSRWTTAERDRAALRAFLDHAVLSASGVAADRPHSSLLVVRTPEDTKSDPVAFAPMSRDEATVWLRSVVRELLQGPHAYFLPCEAVFVHAREDPDGPIGPAIERAREVLGDKDGPPALRSAYGPVPRPQDYPAPDEARARAIVDARFGAFFRKIERQP
jgi:exodeoxyribonuclease V gamma subunit